jgi:hypothetical protein
LLVSGTVHAPSKCARASPVFLQYNQEREECVMYIGIGTIILILVIIVVVKMIR